MVARNAGKILNVASTESFQPCPTMAVYGTTKAYILLFSEAIANELKDSRASVTALCPGPTESGFKDAARMQSSKLWQSKLPSSREVAKFGCKAMMKN